MKLPSVQLSMRERIIVFGGAALVAGFLIYAFVIDTGLKKLDDDRAELTRQRRLLGQFQEALEARSGLLSEYARLTSEYSNQISRIGSVRVPRDIEDILRVEFEKIDRKFGSNIGRTRFPGMETNEMYNLLKYGLSQVQVDWRSLNAALYLIENAGQLVGFDALRISADVRNPRDVQAKAEINVKSFIFPDKGTEPWETPDYSDVEETLPRNPFQIPKVMIPPAKKGGGAPPQVPAGELPRSFRAIELKAIVSLFGKTQAVFYDKAKRMTSRVTVGETITNTQGAVVTDIDVQSETIVFEWKGQEFTLFLRDYRRTPLTGTADELVASRSAPPSTAATPPSADDAGDGDEAAAADVPDEKTEVPHKYEKPLGTYAESQMKTGVIAVKVNDYVKRRYRLAADHGMLVYRIAKLGAAEKAGVQRRDIILSVDGKRVDDKESFTFALNEAYRKSTFIPMTIMREKEVKKVTLELE